MDRGRTVLDRAECDRFRSTARPRIGGTFIHPAPSSGWSAPTIRRGVGAHLRDQQRLALNPARHLCFQGALRSIGGMTNQRSLSMPQTKVLRSLFCLVTLILAMSLTSAPSAAYPRCAISFWANATGTGSTCAAAESNCDANAWAEAEYACASEYKALCYVWSSEITQACSVCNGVWTVGCRIEASCTPGPD
jgi:hypothetical protein